MHGSGTRVLCEHVKRPGGLLLEQGSLLGRIRYQHKTTEFYSLRGKLQDSIIHFCMHLAGAEFISIEDIRTDFENFKKITCKW